VTTIQQRPIAEGLFTSLDDRAQLIGSRCGSCGVVTFPRQSGCPRCPSEDMEATPLARRGRLWTFSTQGFPPKYPPYLGPESEEDFSPFGIGYVELEEGVMVEARLTENDPEKLQIGMEMELVLVPFRHDDDGTEVVSFAYSPTS
jgi:uncharacterized protein